jgi:hypothetical protein
MTVEPLNNVDAHPAFRAGIFRFRFALGVWGSFGRARSQQAEAKMK